MKKSYGVILGALLSEILLVTLILLGGLFAVSYFEANLIVWQNYAVLQYASGADAFWMALYLTSDALLFLILVFLFAEVVLFLVRTAAKIVFKAVEKTMNAPQDKALSFVKKISLLSVFKWLRINTVKKGIVAYVVVIAVMLLSGWIPKAVLEHREALVFRTFETKNLHSKVDAPDFAEAIEQGQAYDVLIHAGAANVHLYQISSTTEAKLYLLYDEERILTDYAWTIDATSGVLAIEVNLSQATYTPYVDMVLPSVEVYLPDGLILDDVTIDIDVHGSINVDYLSFETLDIAFKKGDLNIRQVKDHVAKSVVIEAWDATLTVQFDRVESLELNLFHTRANIRARAVDHTLRIAAASGSDLFLYQISAERLEGSFDDSTIQFREIYAPTIDIVATGTSLVYVNGLSSYPYADVSIRATGGETSLRGLPDDAQGD